jgi:uncharacterized protein (DUF885 family)
MKRDAFILAALLTGCALPQSGFAASSPPRKLTVAENDWLFSAHAAEFLNGYLAWRPQQGTGLGLHAYDGQITDFSRASIDGELARLRRFDSALAAIPVNQLSPAMSHDYRLLRSAIANEVFNFVDAESYTQNPMTYARALDVNIYIKRDFAPLDRRIESLTAILQQAPRIYAAARANLADTLPKPFVETAIEVANGAADFLAKDLVTALKDVTNEVVMKPFRLANDRAIAELRGFAEWLKTEKLPKAHDRFALGREKYQRMLHAAEMIDLPPEKILEIGLKELKREQAVFAETAKKIDPSKPAIEVFKAIQKDHPTAAGLIPDTRKNLDAIRQFLIDRQIISMPSEVRARVEETPQFDRATSFASMDTPGPFERKATEAYYYVTPVEPDWTPQQAEEWLTAFNYYTTDVVSIHEAYPGHYTQFLHLNASKATRLEKIINSYAFVEGWAHYCEQMLIDEGFGANGRGADAELKAAKYRLAQSDEALLRTCRLCCSIKMHCEGMSVSDAAKFFVDNCYYEEKPAKSEAMRGTYDPQYLFYTLGKLQILKLRADWQKQEGPAYSLKRFHDEMLKFGAPPIRLLRERMLKDPAQWGEIF